MEPLGFLVFFLSLRTRGMKRRWRRRRNRESCSSSLFALVCFLLLFFRRLGWRRDWEEKDDQLCFPVFRFLWDLSLFGLEPHWVNLCSFFAPWEPSFSFSWSLLWLCTFFRLTSVIFNFPSVKPEIDGGLGSTFRLPWHWENIEFDWIRDFMK